MARMLLLHMRDLLTLHFCKGIVLPARCVERTYKLLFASMGHANLITYACLMDASGSFLCGNLQKPYLICYHNVRYKCGWGKLNTFLRGRNYLHVKTPTPSAFLQAWLVLESQCLYACLDCYSWMKCRSSIGFLVTFSGISDLQN